MDFPPHGNFKWIRKKRKVQLVRATLKERGSTRQNAKRMKRLTAKGGKLLHNIIKKVEDISIASTMGIATTPQISVTSPSTGANDICAMNVREHPTRAKRCVSTAARPSLVSPCPMKART
eukprot:13666830-Ditylum_brightwellii.AAC.1